VAPFGAVEPQDTGVIVGGLLAGMLKEVAMHFELA
jgi:hypothetical protein